MYFTIILGPQWRESWGAFLCYRRKRIDSCIVQHYVLCNCVDLEMKWMIQCLLISRRQFFEISSFLGKQETNSCPFDPVSIALWKCRGTEHHLVWYRAVLGTETLLSGKYVGQKSAKLPLSWCGSRSKSLTRRELTPPSSLPRRHTLLAGLLSCRTVYCLISWA